MRPATLTYNFRIIPIVSGIYAMLVIMAYFTNLHTTALHIDSADQSQELAYYYKAKNFFPVIFEVLSCIMKNVVPIPVLFEFRPEWFPAAFMANFHLNPRAPPKWKLDNKLIVKRASQ